MNDDIPTLSLGLVLRAIGLSLVMWLGIGLAIVRLAS